MTESEYKHFRRPVGKVGNSKVLQMQDGKLLSGYKPDWYNDEKNLSHKKRKGA